VLVQDRKLAHASFPPQWNDVLDALALLQEVKLSLTSFP
jgi:hypothetical protein